MEPKLSDIMLSLSDMKNQVTNLSNRLDLLAPTPTKSIFEQSHIGTKAFERAMENLDIDSDDVQNLPKRNPRRSTVSFLTPYGFLAHDRFLVVDVVWRYFYDLWSRWLIW